MGAKRHCMTARCPVPHNWPITREQSVPRWVSERRLSERRAAQRMDVDQRPEFNTSAIIGAIYQHTVSPWLVALAILLGNTMLLLACLLGRDENAHNL